MTTLIDVFCKNCDTVLEDSFCPHCGQKNIDLGRPLVQLLGDVLRETFEVDSRAARTLLTLFRRPGLLTIEFLAGRRRLYTPPFRLYLVISILFFVVAAWVAGQGILLFDGQTLEGDAEGQARFVSEELPRLMFVMLPVFALLLKVAYRPRLYFDHLIHALHIHSAAYVILALLLPLEEAANQNWLVMVIQFSLLAWLVGYFGISLRRVYGSSLAVTGGKVAGIMLGYLTLVAAVFEAASHLTMSGSATLPFLTD